MVLAVGSALEPAQEQAENSVALNQQIACLDATGAQLVVADVESGGERRKIACPTSSR